MKKYHKIILKGIVFFREFDTQRGYYGQDILSEDELIKVLMEEVVEESFEMDEEEINRSIRSIPNLTQRDMVWKYISYLEMVAESFEKAHINN